MWNERMNNWREEWVVLPVVAPPLRQGEAEGGLHSWGTQEERHQGAPENELNQLALKSLASSEEMNTRIDGVGAMKLTGDNVVPIS